MNPASTELVVDARPARVRPLRAMAIVLGLGAVAAAVPLVEEPFLLSVVLAMGFAVGAPIFYQWRRGTLDPYEPIHVIGCLYFVYFGLGAIWTVNDPVVVAYDIHLVSHVPISSFYCLLGILSLQAGYWLVLRAPVRQRHTEKVPASLLFVLIPVLVGFAGRMASAAIEHGTVLPVVGAMGTTTLTQLSALYEFSWGLSWLMVLSGRAGPGIKRTLLFVQIPMTLVIALMLLNDKSLLLVLAATPMVALWYTRRVFPWMSVTALLLVLVFLIFPFNNYYRILDERLPMSNRLQRAWNVFLGWSGEEYWDRSVGTVKERFALINSVAIIEREVPRFVPYAKGETIFLPTLVFFVPRVFWADKPTYTFGRDFAVKFRAVSALDQETRIAATVPGELYWNFDVPGILVGMALWGLVMRALYRRFAGSRHLDPVRRAVQVLLLIMFVHWAGGIAGDIVNLVRFLVLIWAYQFIAGRLGLIREVPAVGPAAGKG